MNTMKKTGIIAVLLLLLLGTAACRKDKNPDGGIFGEWKQVSYTGDDDAAGAEVYLNFRPDCTFEMFQKLGAGHFAAYIGTFSLDGELLSGTYSDGTSFGGKYIVKVDGDRMTMTESNVAAPGEYVYTRCSIPDSVRGDASDYGTGN